MFKFNKAYDWIMCYFLYSSVCLKYFIIKAVGKEKERKEERASMEGKPATDKVGKSS